MPTFALLYAPAYLTVHLHHDIECSPTTPDKSEVRGFGEMLESRLLSALSRSTSELLRTL